MTFQALNTAISGLRAAQSQLNAISNNVSNATTPGYSRQIVPQSTQLLRETGQTVGVLTERTIRVVDLNLQRDLWTQVSASSFQDVQVSYLQQVQNFHGPPDREFSIASRLGDLRDSFVALSDIPDDTQALELTLNQAQITADKFNDYADLLTTLRNDSQSDLQSSVTRVNGLLQEIVNINIQIRSSDAFNNSVAGLQDQRDISINALAEELDISFFERSDGVLVVQTSDGLELAGDVAHRLEFQGTPIGALQFYPDSASGVVLINETNGDITRTDITGRDPGGRIGGLIELRDDTLPSYQAGLDELAFQTATRFQLQGLTLFTDQNGRVPTGTPPDPTTLPTPTPVDYVDFSRNIQVNKDIENDLNLLRTGTFQQDADVPTGDNSLIRRIVEFGFGDVNFQEAVGTVDLTLPGGAADLQESLGLFSINQIVTGVDLSSFSEISDGDPATSTDILSALSENFLDFPNEDSFQITVEDPRGAGFGPTTIEIDLSDTQAAFPIDGVTVNNALDQIISQVNAQGALAGIPPEQLTATRNVNGQLILNSRSSITIDATNLPNALTAENLNVLGIQEGTFAPVDPNFTVQVGNDAPVTITIEPGDTVVELQQKLEYNVATETGVPGLQVTIGAGGELILRPSVDDSNRAPLETNPVFGGDITITGGPFSTNGAVNPALATTSQPVGIVAAIFGNFTDNGTTVTESRVTNNVAYQFEVTAGSNQFTNIRNDFLGPNASIQTGIFSSNNLIDFAQKLVEETSSDFGQAQSAFENEDTLRGILQRQFSDESGVNIDEELSNLIVVQTAYAASARVITTADEMFQELINAIRR